MIAYRIETTPEDNGTLLVTCPAFPEVTTFGPKDPKELLVIALAAIEEAIAARISDGDSLPRPATAAERKRHKGPFVNRSCRFHQRGHARPLLQPRPQLIERRPPGYLANPAEQVVGQRHARPRRPRFEPAMQRVRHVANLNHPGHA
jgi:predicted RNase H-like HicB family nuclease